MTATAPASAEEMVCPPETGMKVGTFAPVQGFILEKQGVRSNEDRFIGTTVATTVDYIAGQVCTMASGSGIYEAGMAVQLRCRDLDKLPSQTKQYLRQRDCPSVK